MYYINQIFKTKTQLFNKGGVVSSKSTYVPNRNIQNLTLVLKGKLTELKGKDIFDGVYVKNKKETATATTADASSIYKELIKIANDSNIKKGDGLENINESDVKALFDAGYNKEQIMNIYFGYQYLHEFKGDTEMSEISGLLTKRNDSVIKYVKRYIDAIINKEFCIGLKYPNLKWDNFIKKYKINSEPEIIKSKTDYGKGDYDIVIHEIYTGENIVIGHQIGRDVYENNKLKNEYRDSDEIGSKIDVQIPYQKERDLRAGFNGDYWGIVSSSMDTIEDVAKMIANQSDTFVKDFSIYINNLGGIDSEDLKENNIKFAKGGTVKSKSSDDLSSVIYDELRELAIINDVVEGEGLENIVKEDVKKLLDVGYNEDQIINIYFGYEYNNRMKGQEENYAIINGLIGVGEYLAGELEWYINVFQNKELSIGLKNCNLEWKEIIKKYKISKTPKLIKHIRSNSEDGKSYYLYTYEIFEGNNIVIGHSIGYQTFKNNKLDDTVNYENELGDKINKAWVDEYKNEVRAGFNQGYWGIVSSSIDVIDDVAQMISNQKGYDIEVGDMSIYVNNLGGVTPTALKENNIKFANGGDLENKDSLLYSILNEISSGTIGGRTGFDKYKDIDGIRGAAIQILQRDGDRKYSLTTLHELLDQAKAEYLENQYEQQFAKGGDTQKSFNYIFEKWDKVWGESAGTIRTTPENYWVATIDADNNIVFDSWEANVQHLDKDKIKKMWEKGEIKEKNK